MHLAISYKPARASLNTANPHSVAQSLRQPYRVVHTPLLQHTDEEIGYDRDSSSVKAVGLNDGGDAAAGERGLQLLVSDVSLDAAAGFVIMMCLWRTWTSSW